MRTSKPPKLATWLVEHLTANDSNSALTGDLVEQFNQGRSAAWYWRQVLSAILLTFAKETRIVWVAAGVTALWRYFIYQMWFGIAPIFMSSIMLRPGFGLAWPWSLFYNMGCLAILNALPILVALGVYLGLTRGFSSRRFLQGLAVGLYAAAASSLLFPTRLAWLRSHHAAVWIVTSLPLFLSLLVTMWAARPMKTAPQATGISAWS